jgi:hypothetical protein
VQPVCRMLQVAICSIMKPCFASRSIGASWVVNAVLLAGCATSARHPVKLSVPTHVQQEAAAHEPLCILYSTAYCPLKASPVVLVIQQMAASMQGLKGSRISARCTTHPRLPAVVSGTEQQGAGAMTASCSCMILYNPTAAGALCEAPLCCGDGEQRTHGALTLPYQHTAGSGPLQHGHPWGSQCTPTLVVHAYTAAETC